mmetsp:Transcript_125838/g.402845  ORF Transcript_125838/g.402845 Transcript_125838/m.402845 type:complete len:349 (+) Transcript_125838:1505-2551(+)
MVRSSVGHLLGDAHLEQALSSNLQHVPLHRVHDGGVLGQDIEVLVVEELQTFDVGLVLQVGLSCRSAAVIGIVVVVRIPSQDRNLNTCVATPRQTGTVGFDVVPIAHKPRRLVDDHDLVAPRPGRAAGRRQKVCVVRVEVRELEGFRVLQQCCGHRQEFACAPALVVEASRAEDHNSVGFPGDIDHILLEGQGARCFTFRELQSHVGNCRTHEVHNLDLTPPPRAQEVAQCLVVRVGWRPICLLVVWQRQTHQCGSPLVDEATKHIRAVRLQHRGQRRHEGVALVERRVLGRGGGRGIEPGDPALVVGAKVALFHLLRQPVHPALHGPVIDLVNGPFAFFGAEPVAKL